MKRLHYFSPYFESESQNQAESKHLETDVPLANADDRSIGFEYYSEAGTCYSLDIYPTQRASRLSYSGKSGKLKDGVWYFNDAGTYIPVDLTTDKEPSGKNFDYTPIKVMWFDNANLSVFADLISAVETEKQEGIYLYNYIRFTISAVEWSFQNNIGSWNKKTDVQNDIK